MNQQIIGAGIDSLNMGENSVDGGTCVAIKDLGQCKVIAFWPSKAGI
ncbi:hypothetical protein [Paenibacillus pseudetheri]|nr:hypothetical protein [Paenibacillus pseudetheri]